ncbi:hypothetical protein ACFO25_13945 [Paenactinomyces guangxiensis]|uniref:Uncharacterized protein n=1 Tax=Paenactinomyces guangxiensis TaxID=1490290 RepID=A0A7W1WPH3_9BACL|nr:hypothetical protein [Paenactinomyces guangxiensis]MBA4493543.1 hypothetical protein [Paenactinomyces guangxiensis]MBH8590634.1 hypothetical protein [Paenactinomyces guangxiensis]
MAILGKIEKLYYFLWGYHKPLFRFIEPKLNTHDEPLSSHNIASIGNFLPVAIFFASLFLRENIEYSPEKMDTPSVIST